MHALFPNPHPSVIAEMRVLMLVVFVMILITSHHP